MFQRPVILSSTGEPPTESQSRSLPTSTTSQQTTSDLKPHHHRHHHPQTSSLSVQEPDSGYEASPSSITDNSSERCTFRFEGADDTVHPSESEDDFENLTDSMLLEDIDEWDRCRGCPSSCPCCGASSATVTDEPCDTTTPEASDLSTSSSLTNTRSSSGSLENRPSSLPISIPTSHRAVSQPNFEGDQSPDAEPEHLVLDRQPRHPLSWPFPALAALRNLPHILRNMSPRREWFLSRLRPLEERPRLRRVESNDDDVSSPESEGPEDVFNLSDEMPPVDASQSGPLPDVVSSARRGRSVSVNLPLDHELYRQIGRTLARLSDDFERRPRQEFVQQDPFPCNGDAFGRRRTVSDIHYIRRSS